MIEHHLIEYKANIITLYHRKIISVAGLKQLMINLYILETNYDNNMIINNCSMLFAELGINENISPQFCNARRHILSKYKQDTRMK